MGTATSLLDALFCTSKIRDICRCPWDICFLVRGVPLSIHLEAITTDYLNTSLCDCLPRWSPILKPELAILLHVYYFLFSFIKIHPAHGDNLIKPFSLHSTGNFFSLFTTLAISLSSAHIISTDVISASRMIFHQMEPLSGEPNKKARLFLHVPNNNSILYL